MVLARDRADGGNPDTPKPERISQGPEEMIMLLGIRRIWLVGLTLTAASGTTLAFSDPPPPQQAGQQTDKHAEWRHDYPSDERRDYPEAYRGESGRTLRQLARSLGEEADDLYERARKEADNPKSRERSAIERVKTLKKWTSEFRRLVERGDRGDRDDRDERDEANRAFRSVMVALGDVRETYGDLKPSRNGWSDLRDVERAAEDVRALLFAGHNDDRDWLSEGQRREIIDASDQIAGWADRARVTAERENRNGWNRQQDRVEQLDKLGDLAAAARDFRRAMRDDDADRKQVEYRHEDLKATYRAAAAHGGIFGRSVGYDLNSIGNRLNDMERLIRRY